LGERRAAYRVLVEIPERMIPLVKPRCRWEDNIKMDFREGGLVTDWIDVAEDRDRLRAVVNAVMNLCVP
jgi:hypothetical protein